MKRIKELEAQIKEIEQGLKNEFISEDLKSEMRQAIKEAQKELDNLKETPDKPVAKKPVAKKKPNSIISPASYQMIPSSQRIGIAPDDRKKINSMISNIPKNSIEGKEVLHVRYFNENVDYYVFERPDNSKLGVLEVVRSKSDKTPKVISISVKNFTSRDGMLMDFNWSKVTMQDLKDQISKEDTPVDDPIELSVLEEKEKQYKKLNPDKARYHKSGVIIFNYSKDNSAKGKLNKSLYGDGLFETWLGQEEKEDGGNDKLYKPEINKVLKKKFPKAKNIEITIDENEYEEDVFEFQFSLDLGDDKKNAKPAPAKKAVGKKTVKKVKEVTWRRKINNPSEFGTVQKVNFDCDFTAVKVEEDITFDTKVTIRKGEMLVINSEGYPFVGLTKSSFDKRCISIGKDTDSYSLWSAGVIQSLMSIMKIDEGESQSIIDKNDKLMAKYWTGGLTQDAAARAITLNSKSDHAAAKAKPASVKSKPAPTKPAPKKKRSSCKLKSNFNGELPSPLRLWYDGMLEGWKDGSDRKKKVDGFYLDSENKRFIVTFKHYTPFLNRAIFTGDMSAHTICIQTANLGKLNSFRPRKYKKLLTKQQLKKDYSSKDNLTYCSSIFKQAYKLAIDNTDDKKKKELYQKFYKNCGDLVSKELDIKYIKWLHKQTREDRKTGEAYYDAFSRVYAKLKDSDKNK